jgi:hypothetical protein
MKEVWIPSPHYSTSRSGYNKIVLHTTEGAMKIRDLGAWFQNPSAGCSSHHGADNYERGVFGAYVYENYKAWTQGNANPYCLSLEMCSYSSWSRDTWLNSKGILLDNAAEWIRYCVDKYNVPWTLLNDSQAQNPDVRGICEHVNFGAWGSGHVDCGNFPMDEVIKRAKAGGSPAPPATSGGMMTAAVAFDSQNRPHRARINSAGQIKYMPPGGSYGVIDPNSKAKTGLSIAVDGDDRIFIDYDNEGGDTCEYQLTPPSTTWGWTKLGF